MTIPATEEAASQGSDDGQQNLEQPAPTFDQRVNAVLDTAEKDDKGNIILPDDISEDVAYAAKAEKRRRDTQTALAHTSSKLAVVEAENEGLTTLVRKSKTIVISPEQQTELDELKFSNPDAWRTKMNEFEQEASATIDTQLTQNSEQAQTQAVTGERKILLDAFQHDNPGLVITDDVLKNDVPPRITRALEAGDISFMEFLGKVKEYLSTGKVVDVNKPDEMPNLSKVPGSDKAGENAENQQSDVEYEDAIF